MKWTGYTCALLLTFASMPLHAQMTGKLQSFRQEFVIYSAAAALPSELAEPLDSGMVQVRQQIRYDAPAKRLEVVTFPVLAGSPAVTPSDAIPCDPMERFRVDLKSVTLTGNKITFTGTVAAGAKSFLSSATDGDNYSLSTTYYPSGPYAGTYTDTTITAQQTNKIPAAAGTVLVATTDVQPPVAMVTPDFSTTVPDVPLDASGSKDTDTNLPVDYYWRPLQTSAVVRGCRTATPTVQFAGGPGAYQFVVTVTDATGASTDATVTVTYYGR